jgi:CheY-like chemotaxis protein
MKPFKILVIDDEPLICKGCTLILSGKDQTVNACLTGREGFAAIQEGTYDLVLLDM